jgi:hypothetical protein
MKRSAVLLLAVLALAVMPARADQTTTGTVRTGVLSPTPARLAFNASTSNNGLLGFVFALPPGADGKRYTLKRTSGPTGVEDLDAYFYTRLDSDMGACDTGQDLKETGDTETGTICPAANQNGAWAIVVIKAGANTSFSFTVHP